jgi:hypothetical protein
MAEGDTVGSLSWARATGGRLGRRDMAQVLAQAIRLQLRTIPERSRAALGLRPGRLAALDEDDFRPPDTPAAKEAGERLAELGASELVNHSYRSFAWAVTLAAHDGLRYDDELVYVACLLHDLGLAPPFAADERPKPCFTLSGATVAEQVGERNGWGAARGSAAAEAVTMHLNLWVPPEHGIEAHLTNAGALLDAIGARYWQIAPETLAWVLARYPRRGTKRALIELFRSEAKLSPGTRSAFYRRPLMNEVFFRLAPFEE